MSTETEEIRFNNLGVIHNIDVGSYYSIYGVTSLIVILMLLWFFIRTNISNKNSKCRENMFPLERSDLLESIPEFREKEITPIDLTDEKYKIKSGDYGNVKVNFYDVADTIYDREWDTNTGIYLPNLRTSFKKVNSPYQAMVLSENIKELNKQQAIKPTLLDRAKDTSNALSNAALQISDIIKGNKSEGMACNKEGMACNKEGMACNKEGMACNKEGMACNKEGMADYVCYRCGKYAYECQCSKKINVFNPICTYCKQDVKDCICYMTDYHTYTWRNRYFDRDR
jgi:hypothetical protein